ncbi:hypothetical protein DFH07DRAFT_1062574 [Mycena maculata]|uniref:Uncharacterized protein n=1 Tax=Mycena maculata TaxID=230809 RepID=A0AAD7N771_9AGAR|nr:hypothetical protein DFH07DRAFT_1062574 [Mycena maculata]
MTTMHDSAPNLVPTIPSGTLPQTPAGEWADNLTDMMEGHVTRTPVGTPGPKIPGSWTDEPELDSTSNATAPPDLRAYLPAQSDVQRVVDGAKAYLPQGVASILPGTNADTETTSKSTSSLPPLPPSQSSLSSNTNTAANTNGIDLGPASTTYSESGAEPYGAGAGSDLGRSTTAHTGRSTLSSDDSATNGVGSALESAKAYLPDGVAAYLPGSTTSNTTTGVDLGPASTIYTASGAEPYGAGAGSDLGRSMSSDASTGTNTTSTLESAKAYLPHSVAAYLPGSTSNATNSATATGAVDLGPASTTCTAGGAEPYGAGAGSDLGAASASVPSESLPPPPRADSTTAHTGHSLSSAASVPAAESPAPLAPGESTELALAAQGRGALDTPSLGSNSGYSASTESGRFATPASTAEAPSPLSPAVGVPGSAALNSARVQDSVPSGDADWRERFASQSRSEGPGAPANSAAGAGASASSPRCSGANGSGVGVTGSAGLNSARFEDNVPTGDDVLGGDYAENGEGEGEYEEDADEGVEGGDGKVHGGGGVKEKLGKGRLLGRLKEKMHVGGA